MNCMNRAAATPSSSGCVRSRRSEPRGFARFHSSDRIRRSAAAIRQHEQSVGEVQQAQGGWPKTGTESRAWPVIRRPPADNEAQAESGAEHIQFAARFSSGVMSVVYACRWLESWPK